MKHKIWWNSNFGYDGFEYEVTSVGQAIGFLELLAQYDLYLGEKVQANAGGLIVYEDGEWVEWVNEAGDDIWDHKDAIREVECPSEEGLG